jgi:hypothetical protein
MLKRGHILGELSPLKMGLEADDAITHMTQLMRLGPASRAYEFQR